MIPAKEILFYCWRFRNHCFRYCITSGFFHVLGKLGVRRKVLIIDVMEGKMAGKQSLMTRIESRREEALGCYNNIL